MADPKKPTLPETLKKVQDGKADYKKKVDKVHTPDKVGNDMVYAAMGEAAKSDWDVTDKNKAAIKDAASNAGAGRILTGVYGKTPDEVKSMLATKDPSGIGPSMGGAVAGTYLGTGPQGQTHYEFIGGVLDQMKGTFNQNMFSQALYSEKDEQGNGFDGLITNYKSFVGRSVGQNTQENDKKYLAEIGKKPDDKDVLEEKLKYVKSTANQKQSEGLEKKLDKPEKINNAFYNL